MRIDSNRCIEFDSVFEACKGFRMLEKVRGRGPKQERDHVYGRLKFDLKPDEISFLQRNHVGYSTADEEKRCYKLILYFLPI